MNTFTENRFRGITSMHTFLRSFIVGLCLILLNTAGWSQIKTVQVYIDRFDGVRKIRVPSEQAVTNRGIAWAISASGRTVAYDSNREYPNQEGGDNPEYRIYPFVQWGTIDKAKRPANPIDPYAFLFQETIDDIGNLGVRRVAYTWADYEVVVDTTIAMLEMLIGNPAVLTADEDGRPIATAQLTGTQIFFRVEPNNAEMDSPGEKGSAPVHISSSTLIALASKVIGVGGAANAGQPGAPTVSDRLAAAEWYFFYDQAAMWEQYIEENVLDEEIEGSLMSLDPDEIRQQLPTFYDEMIEYRDEQAEEEHEENIAFYRRMDDRQEARERYLEWREEENQEIIEFARTESRQIAGTEIQVEDQYFLISTDPIPRVPEGRVNIVNPSQQLTPYDILTPQGELVKPYKAGASSQ
jgi:hypothetical protein